jgi:hypothetical protein
MTNRLLNTEIFYHMLGKGLVFSPTPEQVKGFSSIGIAVHQPSEKWLKDGFSGRVLLRVLLPSNVPNEKIPQVTGLPEMNQMLYETIQGLYRDAEARGKAQGKAEGKAQGKAEGKSEGITEGQAGMLIQLLESKFGPLTPYQKKKVKGFDEKTLFLCYQRLFTAKSVQEVIRQRR